MHRWGMLLVVLWVGGLAGCPSAEYRPPQPSTLQEAPAEVDTLWQQAMRGDAEAQYRLGIMAYTGEGLPQNATEAVQWLRRAATQGHPEAQRLLGRLYLAGQGVPRNEREAAQWYRRAAAQGDPEAQWRGASCISSARASPTRPRRSPGTPGGRSGIRVPMAAGLKYLHGLGVPPDVVEAYLWLSLAARTCPPQTGTRHARVTGRRGR
jgi:TPR repeat protein